MNNELSTLSNQISKWQQTHKRGRLPNRLRDKAIALARRHGTETIAGQLNLKTTTLSNWVAKQSSEFVSSSLPNEPSGFSFVELSAEKPSTSITTSPSSSNSTIDAEITLRAGVSLTLTKQSLESVASLLRLLIEGEKPCSI